MACLQCTSVIDENEQYYVADDMGPEIISVIERCLGHQVKKNIYLYTVTCYIYKHCMYILFFALF